MDNEKNNKTSGSYRISIIDNESHKHVWTSRITKTGFFVSVVSFIVMLCAITYCLIAYTPIRTFIPGYPDARSKRVAIQNAIKVDSLERVKEEEQFEISARGRRDLPIEGLHFFTPLKGVVSQGFDAAHPYLDITAAEGSAVKATLDGTVIFTGWSEDDGNTIQIQHTDDIVSIYKHNDKLLKKVGDKVKAGTSIAIVGNTGDLSTGTHLHFELWHKGEAVDPTRYIKF